MRNKKNLFDEINLTELKKKKKIIESELRNSKKFVEKKNCIKKIFVFSRIENIRRSKAGFCDVNDAEMNFFTIKRLFFSDEIWVDDFSEFENFE